MGLVDARPLDDVPRAVDDRAVVEYERGHLVVAGQALDLTATGKERIGPVAAPGLDHLGRRGQLDPAHAFTRVPRSPLRINPASCKAPIAARPPRSSANRQAASTFGPIDPGSQSISRSSAAETSPSDRASAVPQAASTAATSVSRSSESASSALASSPAARSLSITASTPCSSPPSSARTGIPPPPTQTTSTPASSSSWIVLSSTIARGSGEGTTRR